MSRNPSRNSVLRSSYSSASARVAKLSVPAKLNLVGLGWKHNIGDKWGNQSHLGGAIFFSLVFFFFFFIVLVFDRQNAYWKAYLGIFRSLGGQKKAKHGNNSGSTANHGQS